MTIQAYPKLFKKLLEKHGENKQITKCVEELSELQKELCKHLAEEGSPAKIHEEIADVLITVSQMIQLFDCDKQVDNWIEAKMSRIEKSLE